MSTIMVCDKCGRQSTLASDSLIIEKHQKFTKIEQRTYRIVAINDVCFKCFMEDVKQMLKEKLPTFKDIIGLYVD